MALGARMLSLGGLAQSSEQAMTMLQKALDSGRAAEIFAKMVAALGGPADLLDHPDRYLATAPLILPVPAPAGGIVVEIDCRAVGVAVVALGGGRRRAEDNIDYAVGFSDIAALGDVVKAGQPIALAHARDPAQADRAIAALQAAFTLADRTVELPPVLYRPVEH